MTEQHSPSHYGRIFRYTQAQTEALGIRYVQTLNAERSLDWHHSETEPWTLADWGNAMGGECGEAQNVIKKIRRQQTGMRGAKDPDMEVLVGKLADELADTFLYLALVASAAGIDLNDAVIKKFNEVSKREGFTTYLPALPR